MQLFAVVVNRDDTVRVVSIDVKKATPQFYMVEVVRDWNDPRSLAFGYSSRIEKSRAHTSARAALEAYMLKRQQAKESARAVVAQATKQIASANEALMHLPMDEPMSVDAVDPHDGRTPA